MSIRPSAGSVFFCAMEAFEALTQNVKRSGSEFLQIPQSIGIVFGDHAEFFAGRHVGTVCACRQGLAHGALPDRAQGIAIGRLYAGDPATGTVDYIGRDFCAVQFRPERRDLPPQRVVIVLRCDAGFAALTVQPSVSDIIVHYNPPNLTVSTCSQARFSHQYTVRSRTSNTIETTVGHTSCDTARRTEKQSPTSKPSGAARSMASAV